mmetsp:Transcript_99479/g.181455  ORF Transcript_99479/g.181455 Transcript_99479/m.181455 type:complete len:82 (-) Transcript_99479:603-848(-)
MQKMEMRMPTTAQSAHRRNTTSVPAALAMGLKPADPTVAPSLPIAAQKPFRELLTSKGKDSDGRMNVVLLGPKLLKKYVSP